MTNFLSSEMVGYGNNSLLEQWRDTYENADYDYNPYDDDMYEGHEIPDNMQSICDNLDIKLRDATLGKHGGKSLESIDANEMLNILVTHDLYLYMGHGD
ncbi:hypothetical protein Tco_0908934, partial [Tanacetum coccineum]